MLDFFPPSGESSLISVSYTLQVFIAFKGLTMPNKKPLEEVSLQFQVARDGGIHWKCLEEQKSFKPLPSDWAPTRKNPTRIDWSQTDSHQQLMSLGPMNPAPTLTK